MKRTRSITHQFFLAALLLTGARFSPPFADLCERSLLPGYVFDVVADTRLEDPLPPSDDADADSRGDEKGRE